MKITIDVSEEDALTYGLNTDEIVFSELVRRITAALARKTLIDCAEIAHRLGADPITIEAIDQEIRFIRIEGSR